MKMTYEQKVSSGFLYILDRLNPSSPYGREMVRRMTPYGREDRGELFLELDNLEKLVNAPEEAAPEFSHLRRIFMQMRDVRPAIRKARAMCLSDIEFFEIKNFLILSGQARTVFARIRGMTGITGLSFADTGKALDILDPDGRRIPTFAIYEAYSEKLAEIRREKRRIESRMEHIGTEEAQAALPEKRRQVILEEEAEEQAIRTILTKKLRPYLDVIEQNARTTGKVDLLLEKCAAAFFGKSVKPILTEGDFLMENVTNPWIESALKEKNLAFTPLTIRLEKGAGVITGANMSGKSVTLKTITLNVLLALCGFYVYAEKAEIPFFDNVLTVSEEMRSEKQGLSSFGAEIIQMKHAAEAVEREFCFVVLDEFSRGTNPHEGAALVRAVIQYLNRKNVFALLVTHYDGVAEYGKVHYRAAGLKDMDADQVKREIAAVGEDRAISVIASHMNYGLYEMRDMSACPREALAVCRLLGLQEEILNMITETF